MASSRVPAWEVAIELVLLLLCLGCCSPTLGFSLQPKNNSCNHLLAQDRVFAPAPANATPCFLDKCKCWPDRSPRRFSADCSQNNGSLTFVPTVNVTVVTFLNFSFNKLRVITEGFFNNVTSLEYLDLSNNDLNEINSQAFGRLPNLKGLYMNFNYNLTFAILTPVFRIPTLKRLDVRHSSLTPPRDGYFAQNFSQSLEILFLHENQIGDIDLAVFNSFSQLWKLGLATNYVSKVTASNVTQLRVLEIQTNGILRFPETCKNGGNESLFPSLSQLWLIENVMRWLPSRVCLPCLELLQLNGNAFKHFWKDMLHPFPKLSSVFLNTMNTRLWGIDDFAFNSTTLENISVAYNYLDFSVATVQLRAFAGVPRLKVLLLNENYFDSVTDDRFQALFGNLTNLEIINLGQCNVGSIPQKTFQGLRMLKEIYLYNNQLRFIPDGTFDTLNNLTYLDLSNNQLSLVSETAFSTALRAQLRGVYLQGNLFECTCDLLWFRSWLLSDVSLFVDKWKGVRLDSYQCSNIPSKTITGFYLNQQACLLSRDTLTVLNVVCSMLLFTLTLAVTVFRYRWHFRLLLYEALRAGTNRRRRRLRRNFQYDVFLSYASEDLQWVITHLVPRLEGQMGLRVCLHQRDFIPGQNIVDNIADSVEASQKMMMIFSRHFARSQWCQFELALCLSHVIDYDDALLIVRLNDRSTSRDLTGTMMAVLRTTTYIQWEDTEDARKSFWGRLTIALRDLIKPEFKADVLRSVCVRSNPSLETVTPTSSRLKIQNPLSSYNGNSGAVPTNITILVDGR